MAYAYMDTLTHMYICDILPNTFEFMYISPEEVLKLLESHPCPHVYPCPVPPCLSMSLASLLKNIV